MSNIDDRALKRLQEEAKAQEGAVSEFSELLYAKTDDGIDGVIRDKAPQHMKLNSGQYFIPLRDDAETLRGLLKRCLDEREGLAYEDELLTEIRSVLGV